MSGIEFVKLTEKNDHEGETWVFWLQYTGNEDEIAKLDAMLKDWAANSRYDLEFELDTSTPVSEETVDILVTLGNVEEGRYSPAHNRVVGTFTFPGDPGLDEVTEEWEDPNISRERLMYKGGITGHFHA